MKKKRVFSSISFLLTLSIVFISINKVNDAHKASAYVIKEPSTVAESEKLDPITYNGEEMYVAKSTFYDYHSDCEVGTSSTPKAITNSLDHTKNSFELFNNKLFELMKYGNQTESPANYPMYQGRFVASGSYTNIYKPGNEEFNKSTNFWVAANNPQGDAVATQGLVDDKLSYTSSGESYLTQTNTTTGKKAAVPYFDKKFLTTNKFNDSELSLGTVRENVSFPFRRVDNNGVTYYQFSSSEDTIRVNNNGKIDYLGKNNKAEQVQDIYNNPGFFPYNTKNDSNSNSLNYGHGVKIEVPFLMTSDGKLNGKDIIFEFSGDDDVWVFIDGMLALDIGGSHGEIKGYINFADLSSTVDKIKDNKIAFASHSATSIPARGILNNYKTVFSTNLKNSLKDTSKVHTLTFFYMERGMSIANLKLNFNLPEPNKLTVSNNVCLNDVNKTFVSETTKVASNDIFVYDVADKNINKITQTELKTKESISYFNEFVQDDTMIVQQCKLKNSTRNLTELYTTSWNLTDTTTAIAESSNLLYVDDNRTNVNKTFKFANKNNNNTPILTAAYNNLPKVGTFTIANKLTDEFKSKNDDYANAEFKYTVSYKNVFGGNSSETVYKGEYTVTYSDGTTKTKETTNGEIILKDEETAKISGIPVKTMVMVTSTLTENNKIAKFASTNNFSLSQDKTIATGTINPISNIIQYTITDTTKEITPENEVIEIPEEKVENPEADLNVIDKTLSSEDAKDDTPDTSDATNIQMWIILLSISIAMCLGSLTVLAKKD